MVVLSYPELYSDERVVLQAQNVKVKSVLFEIVLTTRRLVLIDTKKNSIPPQEINLATLKDVEPGENAIRDPTITISIITISGNTRQMVLTFSKISGGERRRECDEWVKALRHNITSTVYHPVSQVPVPRDEPIPVAQPPAAQPPAAQPPAAHPLPPAPPRAETNTPPPKKRIEIARPMKKIVEAAPAMPVPVETISLPTGSFCNRCGSRVPPDSAFCNRCGTPVVQDTAEAMIPPVESPAPVEEQPALVVPQIQVAPSPVFPSITDKKDRPIEEVIHSIEPLIEDSVPRTAPAPLIPSKQVHHEPSPEISEPAADTPGPAAVEIPSMAPAEPGQVQWPVLSKSGIMEPAAPAQEQAPVTPPIPGSPPPSPPSRKIPYMLIAVLAFVVLAVIAGIFVFTQGSAGNPEVTAAPTVLLTTLPTTVPAVETTVKPVQTPQQVTAPVILVPASGVWVKVTYSGKFSGTVGTPGRLSQVSENRFLYQISTVDGPVEVSIEKSDGSSAEMVIDVYKDGVLVKHSATTAPKGLIEFQASLKPESVPETSDAP